MVIPVCRDIDVDIDAPDKKGHTPLLTAAFSGSIEAFQFLMISGANLEATGRDGKTAAILAAERNNAKVLEVCYLSRQVYVHTFMHSLDGTLPVSYASICYVANAPSFWLCNLTFFCNNGSQKPV